MTAEPEPHESRPNWESLTLDHRARALSQKPLNQYGELTLALGESAQDTMTPGMGLPVDGTPVRMGKYELLSEIGSGAYGTVYRGRDIQLDRPVAIKVPRLHHAASTAESTRERSPATLPTLRQVVDEFLAEARKLAALKHPGIVTVLDVSVHDEVCLIVSEFLDGPNLNQWMSDRVVPWQEAVRLTAMIAEALAYAHSQSTIHRDLKPGNVILVRRGDGLQPVLVDFGLALDESAEGASQRGVIIGTPNYMSPEQTRGEGHRIDGRTDIYALGTILYRLVCGQLPFVAPTIADLLWKIAEEDPLPLRQHNRQIPRELERICLQALSKRIADRHSTAGDLAAELRALVQARSTASTGLGAERGGEAVQRQVTILSCRHDLLESPAFVESLEPERQYDVLLAFQQCCTDAVRDFDGRVAQLTADSALICFGYPVAHEDAARRAVGSGLVMRDRLREWAEQWRTTHGLQPRIGLGVHTGGVVVQEELKAGASEMLLTGEARHVACQIAAQTPEMEVVVTGETARLLEGYFEVAPRERRRVTGAPRDLNLYRVIDRGQARSRIDVVERTGLTPLVGRDTELEVLRDLWEQAHDGAGQVVCIIGEAGLGKSRLIRELAEDLAQSGDGLVIEWRASALFTSSGLYPAVEWLSRTLGFDRLSPAERLDRLVEHLAEVGLADPETIVLFAMLTSVPTAGRYPTLALSPLKILEKTLEALLRYLRERSVRSTVLFVVEDLHWIDPTTLHFLSQLVDQGFQDRLLTLLTFRPEFETPWGSRANQTHLALNRLNKTQVEQMLCRRTRLEQVPPAIVSRIMERTEGVPLFIEEYANLITESDCLREIDGKKQLADGFQLQAIPATLQDLLVSRLDRLKSVHDVVQLGSVIGRRFSFEWVEAVSGMDPNALRAELDKLVGAEIIFQDGVPPQALYTFKHALIQDAAYGSLLKKKRVDFHRRIGETIETRFQETAVQEPALLAHHFTEAGVTDKAIRYWLKAGQLSQEQSANVEAVAQFRRGLALVETLPPSPERDAIEMQFKLPYSAVLMGVQGYAAPEVEPVQNRCIDICRTLGAGAPLFPVLLANWVWLFVRGRFTDCYRRCPEVIQMAEAAGGPGMMAEAQWTQVCTSFYAGDFPTTLVHAQIGWNSHHREASIEFAKFTQQNSGPLNLSNLGLALWQLGFADQGIQRVHDALDLSIDLKHIFTQAVIEWMVAQVYEFARIGDKTVEYGRRCRRLGDEQAFAMWQGMGLAITGIGLKHLGQYDEAIDALREGHGIIEATSALICGPKYTGHLADALWQAGRRDEARKTLDLAIAKQETGEYFTQAELLRFRGDFAFDEGDFDQAESWYRESLAVAARQQARFYELRTTLRLGRIWDRRGRTAEARESIERLVQQFTEGQTMPDLQEARAWLAER